MTTTPVPRPIQYKKMELRNKTTSELRTVFRSPLGIPNSQAPLYMYWEMERMNNCSLNEVYCPTCYIYITSPNAFHTTLLRLTVVHD